MKALGFYGHQYVASLQDDGASHCVHLHAIINRVHPRTHRAHAPQGDYQTMRDVCRRIELEQGWQYLAGSKADGLSERARAAERYLGVRSLERRVKSDLALKIDETSRRPLAGWDDVHTLCREAGIEYRETLHGHKRGAALIGIDASIRASRAGINHAQLLERLGAFTLDRVRDQERRRRVGAFEQRCDAWAMAAKDAPDWHRVHDLARVHGLELDLHKRGGGLQLRDIDSAETIAASKIDRSLARKALEQRIGKFEHSHTALERAEAREAEQRAESLLRGEKLLKDCSPILYRCTARQSVFNEFDVDTALADMRIYDPRQRELIAVKVVGEAVHLETPAGRQYTTQAVIEEERDLQTICERLASQSGRPVSAHVDPMSADRMSELRERGFSTEEIAAIHTQTKDAIAYACDGSRIGVITGVPGSGKTFLEKQIVKSYEAAGYDVRGVALAHSAAREMRESGIDDADSMAHELFKWKIARARLGEIGREEALQEMPDEIRKEFRGLKAIRPSIADPRTPKQHAYNARLDAQRAKAARELPSAKTLYLVDEASMVGTATGRAFLQEIEKRGAAVQFIGDDRQHQSPTRGSTLDIARAVLGSRTVDLAQTQRQHKAWQREATHAMRRGDFATAIQSYDEHSAIHISKSREESIAKSVEAWRGGVLAGKEACIVAVRNADMLELGQACHEEARKMGRLRS
ncbi:MAG: AAA family ATPase, partial [Candidatus Eremiobacteraeota bacterium]|nr:AAA family ATPase [Candidatus Eremiobacteraeota bacterium]